MSAVKSDFIGKGTMLDAFYREHTEPLTRYGENKVELHTTAKQYQALKDIGARLDNDLLSLSGGIEAIGHFVAVAAQNKADGFSSDRLIDLGYCLEYMGSQINSHRHLIDCVNSDLTLCKIVEANKKPTTPQTS